MNNILDRSVAAAIAKLHDFSLQSTFLEQLSLAFGDEFDRDIAIGIANRLQQQDTSFLPEIEIRSGIELAGANGAFDRTGDRIFISADFLALNADKPATIVDLLLEEIGHKFDILLNGSVDSAGDEGAIFTALVRGETLSVDTLAHLRSEDDRRLLTIDGQQVSVEMQSYVGTSGNDYLIGTSGDDILDGLAGNDTLIGDAGNDLINAGLGLDIVDGGMDNDLLIVDYSGNTYIGGAIGITTTFTPSMGGTFNGNISAAISPFATDRVDFSNIERFQITGTSRNDTLRGGYFQDTLIAGAGDDIIFDSIGGDIIDGGTGFDVLKNALFNPAVGAVNIDDIGTAIILGDGTNIKNIEQFDLINTTNGNDTINFKLRGNNQISTGAGNDLINAGLGLDIVDGGMDNDLLIVDYSGNTYIGGAIGITTTFTPSMGSTFNGNISAAISPFATDRVDFSNIERFQITGTSRNDTLKGGYFQDTLIAGAGDDIIFDSIGGDIIDGGTGFDVLKNALFNPAFGAVNIDDIGTAIILGDGTNIKNIEQFDLINTTNGNDTINFKLRGNNQISTGSGNDLINAGLGLDIVDGGMDNDLLIVDYSGNTYIGGAIGITTTFTPSMGGTFNGNISATISPFATDRVDFSNIERFQITGTSRNDTLKGGYFQDTLIAGAGDDIIFDSIGGDIIDGGTGFDILKNALFNPAVGAVNIDDIGTAIVLGDGTNIKNIEQFDLINTANGNDTINFKLRGNNQISTGSGNDIINAGLGLDIVDGGMDNDILIVDYSSNTYLGGAIGITSTFTPSMGSTFNGNISAVISPFATDRVDFSNIERFQITGTSRNDTLRGGNFQDTFTGGAGDDTIDGGNGGDTVFYAGEVDTYKIERTDTILGTSWIVTDTNIIADGNDGTDKLTNVNNLAFLNDNNLLIGNLIGYLSDNNAGANIIAENSTNSTIVSGFKALTVDGNSQLVSYSLVNNAGGQFAIDSASGLLSVTNSALLNFEAAQSHNIIVKATSADGSFTQKSFTIGVANVNEAPTGTATATLINGTEDTAYAIDLNQLLTGFSDVDGDTLSVANLTVNHGSISLNNGVYTFTPSANYNGAVNLTYDVVDGNGGTIAANSSFTLNAVNDAPTGTATATLINGTEDTAYAIDSAQLLTGFSDVDGDTLAVANLTVNHGSISLNNGVYTFTPSTNYSGAVNLTYDVVDGNGGTIAANSSFTLNAVNDAPTGTATATLINGTEDTDYAIDSAQLLTGFSDVDGDTLAVANLTVNHGSISLNNGVYIFTPAANYNGAVNLTYDVVDGNGGIIAANSSFTLTAVNDAPTGTATATLINGTEDTAYAIDSAQLLTGFSDFDGDTLAVANLTANYGSISLNNGVYTFTPVANYNGAVNLTYDVVDGNGGIIAANSSFTLTAVNDAPTGTATATLINGTEDTPHAIDSAQLLTGFSDVDGDILSVANLTANHGSISLNNGVYTFTPAANYNGAVNLTYDVVDGNGGIISANSSFALTAVNDAPTGTATATLINGTEDTAYAIDLAQLLTGFSDVDGDTLSVANLTANHGSISLNNGVYTFTPAANYNGVVNLTYDVVDGNGGIIAANSSFTLTAVNDAPVLTVNNSVVSIAENATTGIIADADASDVDSPIQNLVFSLINPPMDGNNKPLFAIDPYTGEISLTTWGAAKIDYEVTPSYLLTVKANDGAIDSNIKTILVNLVDILEPTISIDNITVVEGLNNNAVLTVSLSKAWHQAVTANYTTGLGNATANTDYTAITSTISFAPGELTKTISIPILNDNISELDETFNVVLTNPNNATIVIAQGLVTVTDTLVKNITTNLITDAPLVENLTLTGTSNINGTGSSGHNIITGNSASNIIDGGAGNDTMNGGAGDDTYTFNIVAALGNDLINESLNNGADTIILNGTINSKVDLSINTSQVVNTNLSLTIANIENITGGNGNDTLTGNSGVNVLVGGAGNDILTGGGANDVLTGGTGNDFFVFGGSGFTSTAVMGIDKIQDFAVAQDKVRLTKSTFSKLTSTLSNSTFKKVTTDTAAETSIGVIIYNSANGKLFYDTNGSATGFGTNGGQFAELSANLNLTTNDFLLN